MTRLADYPLDLAIRILPTQVRRRYVAEFEFRYNHRSALDVTDTERAAALLKTVEDRRLTYWRPSQRARA